MCPDPNGKFFIIKCNYILLLILMFIIKKVTFMLLFEENIIYFGFFIFRFYCPNISDQWISIGEL